MLFAHLKSHARNCETSLCSVFCVLVFVLLSFVFFQPAVLLQQLLNFCLSHDLFLCGIDTHIIYNIIIIIYST